MEYDFLNRPTVRTVSSAVDGFTFESIFEYDDTTPQSDRDRSPGASRRPRRWTDWIGCIFTQTTTDPDGFPIRDPETTTFVGAIETAEQFGKRIYAEAVRRGLLNAEKVWC